MRKGSAFLVPVLLVLLVVATGAAVFFYYRNIKDSSTAVNGQRSNPVTLVQSPQISSSPSASPVVVKSGTVSGKLCYPSEMIPAGKIAAKNLTDNKIYYQDYLGTQAGEGTVYTFELPVGAYNLRYEAHFGDKGINGYYSEQVTGSQNSHKLITVNVIQGKTVTSVDLCDYYYVTEPSF